jgi:hypothetical protein
MFIDGARRGGGRLWDGEGGTGVQCEFLGAAGLWVGAGSSGKQVTCFQASPGPPLMPRPLTLIPAPRVPPRPPPPPASDADEDGLVSRRDFPSFIFHMASADVRSVSSMAEASAASAAAAAAAAAAKPHIILPPRMGGSGPGDM